MCTELDLDPIDQPVWPAGARAREAPREASLVLPQRRHESAAVPRGACTRRSRPRGRALLAPLHAVSGALTGRCGQSKSAHKTRQKYAIQRTYILLR